MPPGSGSIDGNASLPGSQPLPGIADPNQMAAKQKADSMVVWKSDNKDAKYCSLRLVVATWKIRARGGRANQDFAVMSTLSTAYREGRGATVRLDGKDQKLNYDQVGKALNAIPNKFGTQVALGLRLTYGDTDKRSTSLLSKYKSILSTLQHCSNDSPATTDAEERMRSFTNLRLFVRHGGKLHSTSRGDKLKRTIAQIPPKVLENASGDVTHKDYGIAEHMKYESGKLPLLSFHGFKAAGRLFGMDEHSRAYRQNLRAVTASAFLLGGVEKALEVKDLLTRINTEPVVEYGDKKEDMIQRVLENLAKHADPDALIDDLNFELQRHRMLKAIQNGNGNPKSELYQDIRNKLSTFETVPNHNTITANLMKRIVAEKEGYTLDKPTKVLHDLEFITKKDPVAYYMKTHPGDAKAAESAVKAWVELMTRHGSEERNNLITQLQKIADSQLPYDRQKIYLNAVHRFGLIDKKNVSVRKQSVLLLSYLSRPEKTSERHLERLESQKGRGAGMHPKNELAFNGDEDPMDTREISRQENKVEESKYDAERTGNTKSPHNKRPMLFESRFKKGRLPAIDEEPDTMDDIDGDSWNDDNVADDFYGIDGAGDPENADN